MAGWFYRKEVFIMRWLPYALLCAIFLASADFFVRLASNKISSSMGMLVYGATTFTVSLIWVGYIKLTKQPLLITQQGFLYSLAVGVAFSAVTLLLYLTFARVSVSLGSPTIRVMGILIASLLGILILHEPFTWRYLFGLILTVAGVGLIVFR
jgi:uncharacterized membrane protein